MLPIAALLACAASEEPGSSREDALATELSALGTEGYAVDVMEVRSFALGARQWLIVLVRLTRPDGGHTYAQWMPPDREGARPLVMTTAPYHVVSWTQEEIDVRWSSYAPSARGTYLDVDGPGFDGEAEIYAQRSTPEEVAAESMGHLINDFGALVVFGRFYAGGSVRDDVADMAAGMWLAPRLPQVDVARIGVWGGSWGGFEALWAAREADLALPARAVAALYPVSDFPSMVTRMQEATGLHARLFPPYLRRVDAGTGGPPSQPGANFVGLRAEDLCGRLPETLVLHDEADTIIPVAHTRALVARCGVAPLYWPRLEPADPSVWSHGPLTDGPGPQAVALHAYVFLHSRLLTPEQPYLLELYDEASLGEHLRLLHQAQLAGRDITYALPRVQELMAPKLWLWDPSACATTGCPVEPGATVVSRWYRRWWGVAAAGATLGLRAASAASAPAPLGRAPTSAVVGR